MRQEWLSLFYALIYLSFTVKDRYLISKLDHKISQLWFAAFDFVDSSCWTHHSLAHRSVVAHSNPVLTRLRYLLPEVEELVDLLIHLQVISLSPALQAKKHLLEMRLKLFDYSGRPCHPSAVKAGELISLSQNKPRPNVQKNHALSDKILELVQNKSQCRMRELILALKSDFAPRTIQRHTQQLVNVGRLKKELADGYTVYALAKTGQKI